MRFIKLTKTVRLPEKKHRGDAGYDCYLPDDIIIPAFSVMSVNLKIAIKLKKDETALICARSSIAKKNIILNTSPIDSGYTGSLHAIVHNLNSIPVQFTHNDRICQIVILKIPHSHDGSKEKRNNSGFGSTGK